MKKNFIYNIIYQILVLIIPLVTIPYVSRILGANGIGIYSYTYSIAYYFALIAMLGLNNYGNRAIAKVRDNKEEMSHTFWSIYILQLFTSITMIVCYCLYIILFDSNYRMIAILQIMYVAASMFDINWFFFGLEKFKLTIIRNTITKGISLILIFAFVKTPEDIWKYTLILASSTLISNIILFPFLKKYISFTKVCLSDVFKHLKPCAILFLPVIAVSIYKIMDKIMIGSLFNVKEVGYYENAEKIIQVPVSIITALGTVMLPRISNMISNHQEYAVKKILEKTLPFTMFLTCPMALGILAISEDFSILYFGNEFKMSGYLIQLLSITIIFIAWANTIRTQYLIPNERDKEYIISTFLGAIINFILNSIFITKYGAVGACIGTISAEFIVMFYQSWVIRKELNLLKYIKDSIKFIIRSIIMFIIIIAIGKVLPIDGLLKICFQIVIAVTVYGLLNIKYIYYDLGINQIVSKIVGGK